MLKLLSIAYKTTFCFCIASFLSLISIAVWFSYTYGFDAKSTENVDNMMNTFISYCYISLLITMILFIGWLVLDELKNNNK
jgi:hypothetical protein